MGLSCDGGLKESYPAVLLLLSHRPTIYMVLCGKGGGGWEERLYQLTYDYDILHVKGTQNETGGGDNSVVASPGVRPNLRQWNSVFAFYLEVEADV